MRKQEERGGMAEEKGIASYGPVREFLENLFYLFFFFLISLLFSF